MDSDPEIVVKPSCFGTPMVYDGVNIYEKYDRPDINYKVVPQTRVYCCTPQAEIKEFNSSKSCIDIKGTPYYNLEQAKAKCVIIY